MLHEQQPRKYPSTTLTFQVDYKTLVYALNKSGVLSEQIPTEGVMHHLKLTVGNSRVGPNNPLIVELTKLQPGPDPRLAGYRHMR